MISNDTIRKVRDATVLTDLMEDHDVKLRRSPGGKATGHCFSHEDKNASLTIDDNKGLFCCLSGSCNVGGDAFKFVQLHLRMDFQESVEFLAGKAGIQVEYQGRSGSRPAAQVDRAGMRQTCDRVQEHFGDALKRSDLGKQYLASRGLSLADAERFHLGFAEGRLPDVPHLFDLGLLRKKEDGGRVYPLLRDRLTFAIHDSLRQITGFAGRMVKDEPGPKYINSPESPLFHKSNILYGQGFRPDKDVRPVYLVEGYMDVIACHKAGVDLAEAAMGTSVTDAHLKSIFRRTDTLIVGLDGDKAGQVSANRIIPSILAVAENYCDTPKIRFVTLSDNHDPDSLIRAKGADALQRAIENAVPIDEFLVQECARMRAGRSRAELRMAVHKRLKAAIGEATGPFAHAVAMTVSEEFQIRVEDLLAPLPEGAARAARDVDLTTTQRLIGVLLQRPEVARVIPAIEGPALPGDIVLLNRVIVGSHRRDLHAAIDTLWLRELAADEADLQVLSRLAILDHKVSEAEVPKWVAQAVREVEGLALESGAAGGRPSH